MASTTHNLMISTLLLLSLFSLQIHAREFFSKIPSINNNNNNNEKTTKTMTVPNTQEPHTFNPEAQKQEPEPTFYAETENSYGFYGHEPGHLSPVSTAATTTNYEPYVTPIRSQETYNNYPNNYNTNTNNRNYYNNRDTTGYENEQQNFGETSLAAENENVGRKEYENVERQGMSDTRFLENGKYHYDIKNEERNNYENSYPNYRFRPNSRGSVSSASELYNSNGGGYYGNTENSHTARDFQNDMEEQFEP